LLNYVKIKNIDTKKWKFLWKTFVITWSIEWIWRQDIEKFIKENGWKLENQVTMQTSLLLVGDKPWNNKLEKSKEHNISTYDLLNFLKENNFHFPKKNIEQESLF